MTEIPEDNEPTVEQVLQRLLDALGVKSSKNSLQITRESPPPIVIDDVDSETHRTMAAAWLKAIRVNNSIFGADLANAPSWTILVELYVNDKRPMSVSEVCIASDAPQTTGLRHIQVLEKKGYVYRRPCPNDGRRIYIHLTSLGRAQIETAFALTAESDKKLGLGRLKLA